MRCLISPSPVLSSASTTLRPPSKLPTTIWRVSRPAPSFRRLNLRRRPDETVALHPRCLVVRAQMNHDSEFKPQVKPNHFVEEMQTIMGRYFKLSTPHRWSRKLHDVEAINTIPDICCLAGEAVIIASQLVDSGRLPANGLSTKICADTVQRTLGAYVDVFLCVSKDCYKQTLDRGTVIGFVDALRGLGSISHILLEDALEALNHTNPREGLLEYTFNSDVKSIHHDFNCQMDDLEDGIWNPKTTNSFELAWMTICEGVGATESFLGVMLARRQRTLEKACGGSK